jgi:hypothetical protein
MQSELQFHLDLEAEAAREGGVPPEEAARAARLRAGSVSGAIEELRDQRGLAWLDGSFGDLRQAATVLRRRAGFTTLAAGALALAVAANTLIFSILAGVLLLPLPYPHPDRLIRVFSSTERNPKWPISVGDYLEYKRESHELDSIALYTREDVELMHGDVPQRLPAVKITDDFFPTLGVQPVLGRNFQSSELRDSARVAIVSHRLWTTRLQSDPTIVGRTIKINRESWTVVGVLPADFQHIGGAFRSPLQGDTVALWWPLGIRNI